jgi:hypothetical protein
MEAILCVHEMERERAAARFAVKPLQYFPEHVLVLASQLPPSFWHCSWACFAVSPAKTGNASARVTANIDMKVFMTFPPLRRRDVYLSWIPFTPADAWLPAAIG